jgi:hypothetical protein
MQVLNWGMNDFITEDLVKPLLHFKFYFFSFLEPLPLEFLQMLMLLLGCAAVMIVLGYYYRLAIGFWFFGFTYLWLLDKGFFNNHYYLISILLAMMFFLDADKWNPIRKGGPGRATVPRWQTLVLCGQIFIVFFWGGLNKLNAGWLVNHQPIAFILDYKTQFTGQDFWKSPALEGTMIWGGLVFDLLVIPALWWRRTRILALLGMLAFNGFNFWVFHDVGGIGIFPWLILATAVLFFPPDIGEKIYSRFQKSRKLSVKSKKKRDVPSGFDASKKPLLLKVFAAFLVFQLLFPARHLLIPDHVDWTGEGQRFAWRMKIFYKDFEMHWFMVADGGQGERFEVDPGKMLTPKQYTALAYYPDLIPPTARFLHKEALKKGLHNPVIQVDFVSGLNGWPKQALLDPDIDASELTTNPFKHSSWILPYQYGE